MPKFYCTYCSFKFENKLEKTPNACPYCNKEGTVKKNIDAASILKDVSGEE